MKIKDTIVPSKPSSAKTAPAARQPDEALRLAFHAQAANASMTNPAKPATNPTSAVSWLSTQSSHAAAPYIGKASNCLKVSIHAPGFGNTRSNAGTNPIDTKGSAKPIPSATKIRSAVAALCVSA